MNDRELRGYPYYNKPKYGKRVPKKKDIVMPEPREIVEDIIEKTKYIQVDIIKDEEIEMTIDETNNSEFNIPSIELEDFIEDKTIEIEPDRSNGVLKFGFIGSGQCGGRIAEAFLKLGYTKNIAINTAQKDLEGISQKYKILIGDPTKGGAGKDMKVATEALDKASTTIYNQIQDIMEGVDHIFVCAGLGGGTGGGTVVQLVELAIKYMASTGIDNPEKRVGAIVTLPTKGECASDIISKNTISVSKTLSSMASKGMMSPLIIVDNDKISNMFKKLTVKQFNPTVNSSIAGLLHAFNVIPTQSTNYTVFDGTDFQSTLQCGGHMIMGISTIKSFDTVSSIADSLHDNLHKTLLAADFDLATADVASVIIVGGEDVFESIEGLPNRIERGFDTIATITGKAKVHRGVYSDSKRAGQIAAYTIIGGLDTPVERYKKLSR